MPQKSPTMLPEERAAILLSHLLTPLPIWGVAANGLIYFLNRESSRLVCMQARQGIQLQLVFLLYYLLTLFLGMLARLLVVIDWAPGFFRDFQQFLDGTLWVAGVLMALCCLAGVLHVLLGRVFVYPLIGIYSWRQYQNRWGEPPQEVIDSDPQGQENVGQ